MSIDELLAHTMEVKAMQIEKMLSQRGFDAEITGGSVTSDLISFTFDPRIAAAFSGLQSLSSELATALHVPRVRFSREGDNFSITFQRRHRKDVELPVLLDTISELPPLTAIIGKGHDEHYLQLSLEETSLSNVLIATQNVDDTRHLMRSMAISFAMSSKQSMCQLIIIGNQLRDPIYQDISLLPLNYLPHMLLPLPESKEEIKQVLLFLQDEITYRIKNSLRKPTIIAFIENIGHISSDSDREIQGAVSTILQHGHEAGFVTAFSIEDAPDDSLSPLIRHNIDLRLIGQIEDPGFLRLLKGTEFSEVGLGLDDHRMTAISGTDFIDFKPAKIGDYDLHYYIDEIYRSSDPVLLAQTENHRLDENNTGTVANRDETEVRFNIEQGRMVIDDTDSSQFSADDYEQSEFDVKDQDRLD
jgi:hypothetical protein